MSMTKTILCLVLMTSAVAFAGPQKNSSKASTAETEEFNPFDPNAEEILKEFDQEYERQTGKPSHIGDDPSRQWSETCVRDACPVWVQVVRSRQKMYLYQDGQLVKSFPVSTGAEGHETPDFDRHPNGRVYDEYSSKTYPGGDYKGLGNMPYAVFIQGGFAIHGTTAGNIPKLGKPASHGCIRLHPEVAHDFNRLVRKHGVQNVWITVQE